MRRIKQQALPTLPINQKNISKTIKKMSRYMRTALIKPMNTIEPKFFLNTIDTPSHTE